MVWVKMTHTKSESPMGKLPVYRVDKMSHRPPTYLATPTTTPQIPMKGESPATRRSQRPTEKFENRGIRTTSLRGRTLSDPVASIANVATPACRFSASDGKATLGRIPNTLELPTGGKSYQRKQEQKRRSHPFQDHNRAENQD